MAFGNQKTCISNKLERNWLILFENFVSRPFDQGLWRPEQEYELREQILFQNELKRMELGSTRISVGNLGAKL